MLKTLSLQCCFLPYILNVKRNAQTSVFCRLQDSTFLVEISVNSLYSSIRVSNKNQEYHCLDPDQTRHLDSHFLQMSLASHSTEKNKTTSTTKYNALNKMTKHELKISLPSRFLVQKREEKCNFVIMHR